MKRCPWCGARGSTREIPGMLRTSDYIAGCFNPLCPVQPKTRRHRYKLVVAAEWNRMEPRWIPMADALPDDGEPVVIKGQDGGRILARYNAEDGDFIVPGKHIHAQADDWLPLD